MKINSTKIISFNLRQSTVSALLLLLLLLLSIVGAQDAGAQDVENQQQEELKNVNNLMGMSMDSPVVSLTRDLDDMNDRRHIFHFAHGGINNDLSDVDFLASIFDASCNKQPPFLTYAKAGRETESSYLFNPMDISVLNGTATVSVNANLDGMSLTKLYDDDVTMSFCLRMGLYISDTEMSFHETILYITLDSEADDGFEILKFSVSGADVIREYVAEQNYGVDASLCDYTGSGPFDSFVQGDVIRVCVTPNMNATADGLLLSSVDSFQFSRGATVQQAITAPNTPADNFLTAIPKSETELPGPIFRFDTIMYSSFYSSTGVVDGTGTATLVYQTKPLYNNRRRHLRHQLNGRETNKIVLGSEGRGSSRDLQVKKSPNAAVTEAPFDVKVKIFAEQVSNDQPGTLAPEVVVGDSKEESMPSTINRVILAFGIILALLIIGYLVYLGIKNDRFNLPFKRMDRIDHLGGESRDSRFLKDIDTTRMGMGSHHYHRNRSHSHERIPHSDYRYHEHSRSRSRSLPRSHSRSRPRSPSFDDYSSDSGISYGRHRRKQSRRYSGDSARSGKSKSHRHHDHHHHRKHRRRHSEKGVRFADDDDRYDDRHRHKRRDRRHSC